MKYQYVFAIIVLAVFTILEYYRGRRKNRWMSGFIASETESVLKPKDQEYINIGGTMGFNSIYKLRTPYTEAKGTMVLLPRHSIFYMPVPLLLGSKDKYYLNIFTKEALVGEGHIIDSHYFKRISKTIDGIENMSRDEVVVGKKNFILLWDKKQMEEKLRSTLSKIEQIDLLNHFCCYRDNRTFFILMRPVRGGVEALLGSIMKQLGTYRVKGDKSDGNAEGDDR